MLSDRNSSAIVAVSDIARARAFYEDVLGLTLVDRQDEAGVLGYRTGDTYLTVYQSQFAGTNKANAVTWQMKGDLIETVNALRAKGVVFDEDPRFQGLDFKDGVYWSGALKLAFFRDPDGNILLLNEVD